MVNISLQTGKFAKKGKTTLVKPLIKKLNLDRIKGSYRPVSNLKFLSKIVKSSMVNQFNDHSKQYKLISDYQSAYRENYSCETALVKLVNDILWRMERQKITALTVIDLSSSFQHDGSSGGHRGPEEQIWNWWGCPRMVQNYMYPGGCQVNVRDSISKIMDLPFSVPQWSCSGANLYSAYVSTLQEVIPKGADLHDLQMIMDIKAAFQQYLETRRQLESKNPKNMLETSKSGSDENRFKMNNIKLNLLCLDQDNIYRNVTQMQ